MGGRFTGNIHHQGDTLRIRGLTRYYFFGGNNFTLIRIKRACRRIGSRVAVINKINIPDLFINRIDSIGWITRKANRAKLQRDTLTLHKPAGKPFSVLFIRGCRLKEGFTVQNSLGFNQRSVNIEIIGGYIHIPHEINGEVGGFKTGISPLAIPRKTSGHLPGFDSSDRKFPLHLIIAGSTLSPRIGMKNRQFFILASQINAGKIDGDLPCGLNLPPLPVEQSDVKGLRAEEGNPLAVLQRFQVFRLLYFRQNSGVEPGAHGKHPGFRRNRYGDTINSFDKCLRKGHHVKPQHQHNNQKPAGKSSAQQTPGFLHATIFNNAANPDGNVILLCSCKK